MNNPLPLRAEAIGLVLFAFLPVVLLLVGGFAVWEWGYLDRLPAEAAATHGLDERLMPGVLAIVVFALWWEGSWFWSARPWSCGSSPATAGRSALRAPCCSVFCG